MEGKNNNNISNSQNNINESTSQNTAGFNPYTSPYLLYNDTFEINWNTEIANILRDILSSTESHNRINRDGTYTNFAILFLVLIFIAYMIIEFYQNSCFNYPVGCKLLGMILALFLMVVLLHRHEINVLEELNKNKEK